MLATYILGENVIPVSKGFKDRNSFFQPLEQIYLKPLCFIIEENKIGITKPKTEKAYWINTNLKFEILGKKFSLSRKLSSLYQTIQESKNILELEEDWDGDGALPCNSETYIRSIEFLTDYSNEVLESFDIILDNPEINIARDGSIDLEWRSKNYILLINFNNSEIIDIQYYGEDNISKTIIKGFIEDKSINKDLAFWMKKLR